MQKIESILKKDNIKKYLYLGIMAYLAVLTVTQFYRLFAMIVASIASKYYRFSALAGINYFFAGLAFFALLAVVASVAVRKFAFLRTYTEKFWYAPAALYCVVVLMTVISMFVSMKYLSGFGQWLDAILSDLLTLASTLLYLAVFMLLFPKALFLLEEPPVIDSAAPAASEDDAGSEIVSEMDED